MILLKLTLILIIGRSAPSDDIVVAKWYHSSPSDVPKLIIFEKFPKIDIDTLVQYYDLDIYETRYNFGTNTYTASKTDVYRNTSNFAAENVHAVVLDNLFTLDASNIRIQDGVNFMTYNSQSAPELGGATQLTIATGPTPYIVRKNATDLCYVVFNGKTYSREIISKVITQFGALFIFTKHYVYINNFSRNQLNRISIDGTKQYQVLRDGDGEIYVMPDDLNCAMAGS